MPTVQEVLKQSGFSDEEIAALDAKKISAFSGIVTTAESERRAATEAVARAEQERQAAQERLERAELIERSNKDFYEGTIVTSLNGWEDERKKIEGEKARAAAEAAFYRTQAEEAKKGGFVPTDAPAFTFTPATPSTSANPTRDSNGRYMPSVPGSVPGSPTLLDDVRSALSDTTWTMQQYQKLYGTIYPGDVMQDASEAASLKLPYREHVSRKYKFSEQNEKLQRDAQQKHDSEVAAARDAEWKTKLDEKDKEMTAAIEKAKVETAERLSPNSPVRTQETSRMAEVQRAVKEGNRPDPLTLNSRDRHVITRRQIDERIASQGNAA